MESLRKAGWSSLQVKSFFIHELSHFYRHKLVVRKLLSKLNKLFYSRRGWPLDENKLLQDSLDELGLFKLPKFLVFYLIVSNVTHFFNFFAGIAIKLNGPNLFGLQIPCIIGRFVVHEAAPQSQMIWFSATLSGLHLAFRCTLFLFCTSFKISFWPFTHVKLELVREALQASSIEKLYETSSYDCRGAKLGGFTFGSLALLRNNMFREVFWFESDDFQGNARNFKRVFVRRRLGQLPPKRRQNLLVCRPNRTLDSWHKLEEAANFCLKICGILFVTVGSVAIYFGVRTCLFRQAITYEDCEGAAEADYKTPIYWYRVFATTSVSSLHGLDLFFSFTVGLFFMTQTSCDLVIYWSNIHNRLVALAAKISLLNRIELPAKGAATLFGTRRSYGPVGKPEVSFSSMRLFRRPTGRGEEQLRQIVRIERFDLHSSVCDFFKCLRQADSLVSTTNAYYIFGWLSLTTVATLTGLKTATSVVFVRLIAVIFFVVLLTICGLSLRVKRAIRPSYSILCTLAALDSAANKKLWVQLLEFYTPMRRYGFTLYKGKAFTELEFLKIISYTFTIVTLVGWLGNGKT